MISKLTTVAGPLKTTVGRLAGVYIALNNYHTPSKQAVRASTSRKTEYVISSPGISTTQDMTRFRDKIVPVGTRN